MRVTSRVILVVPLLIGVGTAMMLSSHSTSASVRVTKGKCVKCGGRYSIDRLQFLNRRLGWASAGKLSASGNGSAVLRTTDGGRNWQRISFQGLSQLSTAPTFAFLNTDHGWVAWSDPETAEARVDRTTDSGRTWTHAHVPLPRILQLRFFDIRNGYSVEIGLDGPAFAKTTDAGETWTSTPLPLESADCMCFLDASRGAILGRGRRSPEQALTALVTEDRGNTWQEVKIGGAQEKGVDCGWIDLEHAWVVSWLPNDLGSRLLLTSSGGRAWTEASGPLFSGEAGLITAAVFRSLSTGFLAWDEFPSGKHFLATTTNGGATWTTQRSEATLVSCQMLSEKLLCASGMNVVEVSPAR